MGENLNINAVNQVEQNTVIYEKREPLTSVSLIIKGRVLVETDGIRTIFSSGNFLGACDVGNETHSFTYTAYDNVVLCTFSVRTEEEFMKVLAQKKEYYGLLNTSLNFFIVELNQTYEELIRRSKLLKEFVCEKYEFYQEFGKENGLNPIRISAIELLMGLSHIFIGRFPPFWLTNLICAIRCRRRHHRQDRTSAQQLH